jgi:hypothetical protein
MYVEAWNIVGMGEKKSFYKIQHYLPINYTYSFEACPAT